MYAPLFGSTAPFTHGPGPFLWPIHLVADDNAPHSYGCAQSFPNKPWRHTQIPLHHLAICSCFTPFSSRGLQRQLQKTEKNTPLSIDKYKDIYTDCNAHGRLLFQLSSFFSLWLPKVLHKIVGEQKVLILRQV